MENRYLSIKEAAELTGISVSTLYKLVCSRRIPVYKPTGKLLFLKEELIAWVGQGKQHVVANQ